LGSIGHAQTAVHGQINKTTKRMPLFLCYKKTKILPPAKPPLDADAAKRILLDAEDEKKAPWCTHCGMWHLSACPRVRRLEFRGGEIVSVEFWGPTWDKSECYSQLEVAEAASAEDESPTE